MSKTSKDVKTAKNPEAKKPVAKRAKKPAVGPENDPMPKKPLTAYFMFAADEAPKLNGEDVLNDNKKTDVSKRSKELGKRWRALNAEKKAEYKEKYDEHKAAYIADLEKWAERNPEAAKKVEEDKAEKKAKAKERRLKKGKGKGKSKKGKKEKNDDDDADEEEEEAPKRKTSKRKRKVSEEEESAKEEDENDD